MPENSPGRRTVADRAGLAYTLCLKSRFDPPLNPGWGPMTGGRMDRQTGRQTDSGPRTKSGPRLTLKPRDGTFPLPLPWLLV